MKKYYFLLIQLLIFTAFSSAETEKWFSMGFEYSHVIDKASYDSEEGDYSSHTQSIGIPLSGYIFTKDHPFGFFIHTSLLKPQENEYQSFRDTDICLADSMIIGAGYRGPEYWIFQPYGSLGIHYLRFICYDTVISEESDYTFYQYSENLGLGGEIGCKVNLTDYFYIGLGTLLAWDFISGSMIVMDGETTHSRPDKYRGFMVDPFITFGYVWRNN